MATVAITYVGPHDGVEIAATGQIVGRGSTVKVDAEIAGRSPSGEFVNGVHADPGEGLLAQFDAWKIASEPVKPEKGGKE